MERVKEGLNCLIEDHLASWWSPDQCRSVSGQDKFKPV